MHKHNLLPLTLSSGPHTLHTPQSRCGPGHPTVALSVYEVPRHSWSPMAHQGGGGSKQLSPHMPVTAGACLALLQAGLVTSCATAQTCQSRDQAKGCSPNQAAGSCFWLQAKRFRVRVIQGGNLT